MKNLYNVLQCVEKALSWIHVRNCLKPNKREWKRFKNVSKSSYLQNEAYPLKMKKVV